MQLEHEFTVPVGVAHAWEVLLDVERVAPCMPGATVESFDGQTIDGRVKIKVGPIQVTYAGTARFVETDATARRAVIDASAKEARGSGTAQATITAQLHEEGASSTKVTVTTDLAITGKPAQFGRGVMVEVGDKILGRFADCLAGELGSGAADTTDTGSATDSADAPGAAMTAAAPERPHPSPQPDQVASPQLRPVASSEPIDLVGTAGLPVLKRLAPLVLGALLFLVVWRLARRRG